MNLVLFDIDGTILDASNAGSGSFMSAIEEVFGSHPDDPEIIFAGNTDLKIIEEIMGCRGESWSEEDIDRFFSSLPGKLKDRFKTTQPTMYPGCMELLEELHQRNNALLGLVTGNIESCARVKLDVFGLSRLFPFGGFGNDHHDRKEMARLAVERGKRHITGEQELLKITLIGDTPSDISAAKAIGAQSIAVTTGGYSREALVESGADVVFDDLQNTHDVLQRLI